MVSILAFSQEEFFKVENDTIGMSRGEQVAYIIYIPEVTLDRTEHNWKKFFSKVSAIPIKYKTNEIQIKNAKLRDITDKPVNIYSLLIKPDNDRVKIIAFFEIDSIFFTPFKTQTVEDEKINYGIQHLLTRFARNEYLSLLKDKLFEAKSRFRVSNSQLNKLERENEKILKDKASLKLKVRSNNTELQGLENDNTRLIQQIEEKKNAIAAVRDDDELFEIGKKQLKSLKKEKKKIDRSIEKITKLNISYSIRIEKLEKEIKRIKSQIERLETEVDVRSEKVTELKNKIEDTKN
jgi:predicted  nucleic acid-binding Zn-ribbon protein